MSIRGVRFGGLVALGVMAGVLFSGPVALGAEVFGFRGSFGASGVGDGQFSTPTGIAVNRSTGEVYVADQGNNRVERFDSEGKYLSQFNGEPTPAKSFVLAAGGGGGLVASVIAVDNSASPSDPSAGDVYVADQSNRVIDKFSSTGSYVGQLTGTTEGPFKGEPIEVTVDSAGVLFVYESELELDRFDNAVNNNFVSHIEVGLGRLLGMSLDSKDSVYAVVGNGNLFKVSGAGEFEGVVDLCGCASGVAVDRSTNNVYVDHGTSVAKYGPFGEPSEEPLLQFGAGHLSGATGIAVDSTSKNVYVADSVANSVDIFGQVVVPDVSTGSISGLRADGSVTLEGTVNPDGVPLTGCRFEYGPSTSYKESASCDQTPEGNNPVMVTAKVTGLLRGTIYHYRLAAGNGNGGNAGSDETFPTQGSIEDHPAFASGVTQAGATLNATIDPGILPTSYHFLYGPTGAYGSVAPNPDLYTPLGYKDDPVIQTLTGLRAGTTYHFAIVITDAAGVFTGLDETFTTPPVPPPVVSTDGTSEVSVGAATLSGAIDPQGWETAYHFQYGTSTAYGSSWPTVDVALGAQSGAQSILTDVQNLQPGTVYHYRLVATSPGGTTYGTDQTFTTNSYPVSMIQVAPVGAPLGIAPAKTSKPKSKPKSKTHKHKTKPKKPKNKKKK